MRFHTLDECERWSAIHGLGVAPARSPFPGEHYEIVVPLSPLWNRTAWFASLLAQYMGPFEECLLWVTQYGVWPSTENMHLFDRLRYSYGEKRPLDDAPGQVFLTDDLADLCSFIQICLLCLWDFHLIANPSQTRVFVSHDEFVHLFVKDESIFKSMQDELKATRVEFSARLRD
jgi:hypothetical protein